MWGFVPADPQLVLIDSRGRLQIDRLPLALNDARANLGGGLAFLVLLVGVVQFLQAGGAAGAVRGLKAAVQAVVPHAVAVAITRLLVQHRGDFRRQVIRMGLVRILPICSPQF